MVRVRVSWRHLLASNFWSVVWRKLVMPRSIDRASGQFYATKVFTCKYSCLMRSDNQKRRQQQNGHEHVLEGVSRGHHQALNEGETQHSLSRALNTVPSPVSTGDASYSVLTCCRAPAVLCSLSQRTNDRETRHRRHTCRRPGCPRHVKCGLLRTV